MNISVIKTEKQYREYLSEIQLLLSGGPDIGPEKSERLELLSVLVEAYETHHYPMETPDPVDAILFRMQEKGLKQADLIPYFGSRSRVSEILARKRPLTVPMIRALSVGLGIPAEVLINDSITDKEKQTQAPGISWTRFPINEMTSRGWIKKTSGLTKNNIEKLVQDFIDQVGWNLGEAAFKSSFSGEAYSPTTVYALYAWLARVVQVARKQYPTLGLFDRKVISASFIKELVQLSWLEDGPKLAIESLKKHGIAVVIEPHLKGTMLDGAALQDVDGRPIIGLTLRYDRLDNFWYTIAHELAHIWKHVGQKSMFLDDLTSPSTDPKEAEANRIAREALIPKVIWKRSEVSISPNRENIDHLSRHLRVHPSIIAGRIRRETGRYELFSDLVEQGGVRKLLSNIESN